MSRSLKLTRPSSRRLILDSEARIVYPAAARVRPLASRSCRSCAPSRMRSAVGLPPGLADATSLPPPRWRQHLRYARLGPSSPVLFLELARAFGLASARDEDHNTLWDPTAPAALSPHDLCEGSQQTRETQHNRLGQDLRRHARGQMIYNDVGKYDPRCATDADPTHPVLVVQIDG